MRISDEQIDIILSALENNSDAAEEARSLPLAAEKLRREFNAQLEPLLKRSLGDNAELLAIMAKLFLMNDVKILPAEKADLFVNIFGDSVAIFGVTPHGGGDFKLLTCAYTVPQDKRETLTVNLVLSSFIKVLAPSVDVQALTQTSPTASFVKDGVKFSATSHENLIMLTAVAE